MRAGGPCLLALRVCVYRKIRGEPGSADRTAAQGGVTDLQRGERPTAESVQFDLSDFVSAPLRALRGNAPPKNKQTKKVDIEGGKVRVSPDDHIVFILASLFSPSARPFCAGSALGGTGEAGAKLCAYPVDDPLHAGRWINFFGPVCCLFIFTADPRSSSGLFSTLTEPQTAPLEMTEEYVLRCVLMLCCALLSANASNWL